MSANRGSGFSARAAGIFLIIGLLLPAAVFYWGEETGAQGLNIYVSPSGSTFTTIQAAIDAADPGDTIFIGPGEYNEQVLVNEEVTLHGNGTQYCYLNSTGGSGITVNIQANNVTIRNLNITVDDPFAKGKFATYLLKTHGDKSHENANDETAHRTLDEAQLFLEAAHGCYQRITQAAATAAAAAE